MTRGSGRRLVVERIGAARFRSTPMDVLVDLEPSSALHDQVLDQTFPLWNDGLTRERYAQYNRAQFATAWGKGRLRRVGIVDHGRVVASAKRYSLRARVDGVLVGVLGIGAVFTPPELRGRGHAARLLDALMAQGRSEGHDLALLFSEIGPAFYERLGFAAVQVTEVDLHVAAAAGAPAMLVRSGETDDLPFVVEMQEALSSRVRFALAYDADWVHYALAKKRMLAAFGTPGARELEFVVAEEGGRAVAWLVLQVTGRGRHGYREGWTLEGCGDRDPSGARVGAMLQTLLARTPAQVPPLIRGWWPAALRPPQVTIHRRSAPAITPMVRALSADVPDVGRLSPSDVLYWHGDAF